MRAVPDHLVADGFSSSVIEAVVRGPEGERRSGIEVVFDITSPGVGTFFDLGNLAPLNGPRPTAGGVESGPVSAVSDGDGVARARYWAPFRTDQENDIAVEVTGRPAGTNLRGATFRSVQIFLRAANRPSFPGGTQCSFILEPHKEAYAVGEQIFFTATQSTGGGGQPIARYEWDFGDGSGHVGRDAGKIYTATGTYTVTLYTTESVTGTQTSCTRDILVTVNGEVPPGGGPGGGGGGGGGGGVPPGQVLYSFTSMDVPKGANAGTGCPNSIPCIISTVDTSGVPTTGTVVLMRLAFGGTFADTSDTHLLLTGPGYPTLDERAAIDADGVGAGFGAGCNINPRGTFTGPGATTFDPEAPTTLAGGGTAPYDGSYDGGLSPGLVSLASDLNTTPANRNGTFTLVVDRWTAGGITAETLDCWTLEIWIDP